MKSTLGRFLVRLFSVAALSAAASVAWADDFCCECRDKKTYAIEADDDLAAGLECSLKCKRPTRAKAGKCPAPPASSTPGAAQQSQAGATTPASSGSVVLYASEDCSGDGKRVSTSTAALSGAGIAGARSYMVESGPGVSVWEKADYAGRKVEAVGPGICISPGWEVGSVRFSGQ
ncbi:MAG: hypothetical protein IT532_11965 [Burkholderiales bacterium]|nr:hypothetical protein [Burkholderiales bacterium]